MVIFLKEKNDNWSSFQKIKGIPGNYNFELPKTLRVIKKLLDKEKRSIKISMQYPDGLLQYAPFIIDLIFFSFGQDNVNITILNDVVYGACCVDESIESDLIIHYGHSCLIPITEMEYKVLYIFVDIKIDIEHLYQLICNNFSSSKIALVGTIQFNSSVNRLAEKLNNSSLVDASVPRVKPLSKGELLGCTSPVINENVIVYIGDGRFHLESAMMKNHTKQFYKYCPFTKKLTREYFDYNLMLKQRNFACQSLMNKDQNIGVVLSTLGKQGNLNLFKRVVSKLTSTGFRVYQILCGEISDEILKKYYFCDIFVHVSCPRLSIDWGSKYSKPLLTPYEIYRYLDDMNEDYRIDYYSKDEVHPWNNYYSN